MILIIIFFSIISMFLYRFGGLGREQNHWSPLWLRNSWVRDWLCPACVLIPLFFIHQSWLFLLSYVAIGGALTTYWDEVPFNEGEDNLWMSGFMVGFALFPLYFVGFNFWLILLRSVLLALIWGGTNRIVNNNKVPHSDFIEEYTRGFSLAITSLLVF